MMKIIPFLSCMTYTIRFKECYLFFPTLGSIATKDVITIDYNATIDTAIEKMNSSNHRNIIVVNHAIYYVLTTLDLINLRSEDIDFSQPIASLRLKQVPTLPEDENVINAVDLTQKEHEYICITDKDQKLKGIVTNSDIVASVDPQIMLENLTLGTLFEQRYSFIAINSDKSMKSAISSLKGSSNDCIIAVEEDEPVGILTSKDILRYFNAGEDSATVRDYMSSPLQTLTVGTPIKEAMKFVNEMHFKRVVVVDTNGKLAGIVSQQELISQTYLRWSNLVKEHYHEVEELSQILEQQNKQLASLATKDRLTGVNNRHMFEEQFEKEEAYAVRYNEPLHLIILDIDYFKKVNDTFGHMVGDSVLKEFAQTIEKNSRSSDFFARWGGEEFVLLLRNTDDDNAFNVADKLRLHIQEYPFDTVGNVTCSIGMCRVDPKLSLNENLSRADEALYLSKSQGRNTVNFYGEESL